MRACGSKNSDLWISDTEIEYVNGDRGRKIFGSDTEMGNSLWICDMKTEMAEQENLDPYTILKWNSVASY